MNKKAIIKEIDQLDAIADSMKERCLKLRKQLGEVSTSPTPLRRLEIWEDITGYEKSYVISSLGQVKSLERTVIGKTGQIFTIAEKILRPKLNSSGYLQLTLIINGNKKTFLIHRLVAMHFISNPLDLPEVNHKEGNKLDNRAFMLEWVDKDGNREHAKQHKLFKRMIGAANPNARAVIDLSSGIRFSTIKNACEATGLKKHVVLYQLSGRSKNKRFKYATNEL